MNFSEKEKFVFENRIYCSEKNKYRMTLKQIGEHFNVTPERIRQIESKLLSKLYKITIK